MPLTLKMLAAKYGLPEDADEAAVTAAMDRSLTEAQAAGRVPALEAELSTAKAQAATVPALTAERDTARADLAAAQKMLAEVPPPPADPPPAPSAKYKAGDRVTYKGAEKTIKTDLGSCQCYALDDDTVAPEQDLEQVSAEVAARATDTAKALAGVANLARSKMPEDEIKALGLQVALGKVSLSDAMDKIKAAGPTVPGAVLTGMKREDTRGKAPAGAGTAAQPDAMAAWQQTLEAQYRGAGGAR